VIISKIDDIRNKNSKAPMAQAKVSEEDVADDKNDESIKTKSFWERLKGEGVDVFNYRVRLKSDEEEHDEKPKRKSRFQEFLDKI
jgi:hypothetical protein